MLDINLGNKTLVVGVLVALILSYGMVNFDSGKAVTRSIPMSLSATTAPATPPEVNAVAQADDSNQIVDDASLNTSERRELRRHKNLYNPMG